MSINNQQLGQIKNQLYSAGIRGDKVYGVDVGDLCTLLNELTESREALEGIKDHLELLNKNIAPN